MLSWRNRICLQFLPMKPAFVHVSYVSKGYGLSPIPVGFLLLVITSLLQEDANVKGRYCHREKGVTCPGRTFLSGDLGSDFAFIGDWCWDEHVSDVAVLCWSASRELSKQNLHWRELFGSVGYECTYNKLQLLDELLMLKMLWHGVLKSSLQVIAGLQFSQQLQSEDRVLAITNIWVIQKHLGV